jgi:DNA-binding CsgD family transcriptional regulator
MKTNGNTPLSPAHNKLLQTCLTLKTTNTNELAKHLQRSPATVRNQFQEILVILHVRNRYAALRTAEESGWLSLNKISGDE